MALNFETDFLIKKLKKIKPKKVLVQLAEGIKQNAIEFVPLFEKLGIDAIFSGETAWGACSLAIQEAKSFNVDLIVHFGHAPFIKTDFPVIYVEVRDELNLNPILKKSLPFLKKYKKIGYSYSIQHRKDTNKVVKFYEKNNKKVILSKKLGNVAYEGHIVGCQYMGLKSIEKDVDCFVILGDQFHGMGAALSVDKPVIMIDIYNDIVQELSTLKDKILRQRIASIEKFKQGKNIGIIIESKLGQKFGSPKYIIEKLKEKGKTPIVITMNEITPSKILNFYNIDAFIELACPRIAIDDFSRYQKTIITFKEALIALGIKSWEETLKRGLI